MESKTPRVYRYLPLDYGLEALQQDRFKVGRMQELNDPFDCFPRLTNGSLDQGEASVSLPSSFLHTFASQLGLICYSARVTDPVIWSHYAEAHKGIAIGFDFTENYGLRRVEYREERFELDVRGIVEAKNGGGVADLIEVLSKAFTVKATSWGYEEEYRRFRPLDNLFLYGRHYFERLPCGILREVVIGAKSPIEVCDMIRCLNGRASDKLPEPQRIVVKKARMSPMKHEMLIGD